MQFGGNKIIVVRFLRNLVEKSVFNVCSSIATHLGVQETRVRVYFIYATFLTFGSPLVFYLAAAFWLNIKKYIRNGRRVLFE